MIQASSHGDSRSSWRVHLTPWMQAGAGLGAGERVEDGSACPCTQQKNTFVPLSCTTRPM